jgi:hypothetical protein
MKLSPLRGKEGASTLQTCFFMPIEGIQKLAVSSPPLKRGVFTTVAIDKNE